MNWIKKIFSTNSIKPVTYSDFENRLLDKLKRYESYCSDKGKTFYIEESIVPPEETNHISKIEILGSYNYQDVDGTVSGTIAKKEDGEIINVRNNILYPKKPHHWISYLDSSRKRFYASRLNYDTDDELKKEFFDKLPKEVLRDIKINSIIT